jgi:hypothetical protein
MEQAPQDHRLPKIYSRVAETGVQLLGSGLKLPVESLKTVTLPETGGPKIYSRVAETGVQLLGRQWIEAARGKLKNGHAAGDRRVVDKAALWPQVS